MTVSVNIVNFVNFFSASADLFFIWRKKYHAGLPGQQVNKVNQVHGHKNGCFWDEKLPKKEFSFSNFSSAVNFYEHLLTIKQSMSGFLHAGVNIVNLVFFEVHGPGKEQEERYGNNDY